MPKGNNKGSKSQQFSHVLNLPGLHHRMLQANVVEMFPDFRFAKREIFYSGILFIVDGVKMSIIPMAWFEIICYVFQQFTVQFSFAFQIRN